VTLLESEIEDTRKSINLLSIKTFPRKRCMYIYIYMKVSTLQLKLYWANYLSTKLQTSPKHTGQDPEGINAEYWHIQTDPVVGNGGSEGLLW